MSTTPRSITIDDVERLARLRMDQLAAAEARLAAISDLHRLDTDGHSCTCGLTAPCPTRRVLDREGTT